MGSHGHAPEVYPPSLHARVGDLQPNPADLSKPLRHPWLLPLTLAEQLQAPPLLAHLQAQHLLQHLLPLGFLGQAHPLQLLRIQPKQGPAWGDGKGVAPRSMSCGHQERRQREVGRGGTDPETGRRGNGERERGG